MSESNRSSRSLATHTFRLLLSPDSFELVTGITRGLTIEMFHFLPNSALAGGELADSAKLACRIVEQPNQSQPTPCVQPYE